MPELERVLPGPGNLPPDMEQPGTNRCAPTPLAGGQVAPAPAGEGALAWLVESRNRYTASHYDSGAARHRKQQEES
ncbi:hypothetical protein MKUB_44280 [Mycobacterium kubicae]|uniref:Uncharacterized protein n=1 Tax=Mycobacterium kubicae TaxID=120959 RepID=A0ABQ1BT98_9MYCO|nr:hypothetical protein MKUB_44280 [Mycobacterium kubicae]